MENKSIELLSFGLDFTKDMSPSDWIRAPFLILAAIIKFFVGNLFSIIIIIIAIFIIWKMFKFFRWWKKEKIKDENKKS